MVEATQLTDQEFELLCHRQTYETLVNNPARYNLSTVPPAKTAGGDPCLKCPCCNEEVIPANVSFVVPCPKCDTNLLLIVPPDAPAPASRRRKKGK